MIYYSLNIYLYIFYLNYFIIYILLLYYFMRAQYSNYNISTLSYFYIYLFIIYYFFTLILFMMLYIYSKSGEDDYSNIIFFMYMN